MTTAFRNNLLILHRWSGLTMGLVIVFLAVTGALAVLRPSLDDLVNRDLHVAGACSSRIPLDALATAARAAHPAGKLHSIEVNAAPGSSVAVKFTDKDYVYLNPCSGAVLGIQNQYGGLFGLADSLHRFRFIENGRLFAGWNNVAFLMLLIVGGLYLWWPRDGKRLRNALKFNRRLPGSARLISVHKVAGIYTSVVLITITVTALPISFEPVQEWFYTVTSTSRLAPPPRSAPAAGAATVSMERAWKSVQLAFPDAEWAGIRYPLKPRDPVAIEVVERGAPHEIAKSYLYLDAGSGAAIGLLHYVTDIPLGRKVYLYCIALHSGLVGGLPYQVLLLLACLGIVTLAYSGFSPWLRRKLRTPAQRMLTLRLAKKTQEAQGICSFELVDPTGRRLPLFGAGAHIDVVLAPGLVRQYSLCGDPSNRTRYLIGVQLAPDSRGGSRALHALDCGAKLFVSAPKNHFPLAQTASRSLLFAGGIGITPILAMAEQLAARGAAFELHYSARSPERAAFITRIAGSSYSQHVHFHFSDSPGNAPLDAQAVLGKAEIGTHIYVCGPQGYMNAVIGVAQRAGWPDSHVHCEFFRGTAAHHETDVAFDVKLASSGKVIRVESDQTVLAALNACGVDVQSSCAEGVCGSCQTRVLEGEPEHRDLFLSASERARNDTFMPCCSRASGPMLVIDL